MKIIEKDPRKVIPDIKNSDIDSKIIISRATPGEHYYTSYAIKSEDRVNFRGYVYDEDGLSDVQTWDDQAGKGLNILDLICNERTYYSDVVIYVAETTQDLNDIIKILDIGHPVFLLELKELASKVFKDQTIRHQP